MFSLRTLSSLLVLALILGPLYAEPSRFLEYSASYYKNLRITFDYTNLQGSLNDETIQESLLPPIQSLLESTFKVVPRDGGILARSTAFCKDVEIPRDGKYFSGDIVIFITSTYSLEESFVAKSSICDYDEKTGRPIVGSIQFNNQMVLLHSGTPVGNEYIISQALHEIIHILGFKKGLFSSYINPETLKPLTGHFGYKIVNGVSIMVLDLPPLTKRLQAYFNCSTLEGAYLENQDSSEDSGSHFERRIFYNEIMTTSRVQDKRLSEFTLAFLEGTGWYQVDYKMAEPMTYGKNQGCAFLDTTCINSTTKEPNFKEFCSPLTSVGISWTKRGYGSCGASKIDSDQYLISAFDYWGNKTIVDDEYSDNCPLVQMTFENEIDCENSYNKDKDSLWPLERYGLGSKAFLGTLSPKSTPSSTIRGFCLKTKCAQKEDGNYNVSIFLGNNFGEESIENCTAAGEIAASGFIDAHLRKSYTGVLRCPDPNEFCAQIETEGNCRGNCFGNGACVKNQCKCNEGWTSANCAEKQEVFNSSRCTQNSDLRTRYGNDCICSKTNITCQCNLGKINDERCPNYKPDVKPEDNGLFGGYLIPVIAVLFLACCCIGCCSNQEEEKQAQAPAARKSLARPILPKNPKQSVTTL